MLTINRFFSSLLFSNMYIIIRNNKALIIDPCISEEALLYIKDNSLLVDYIILTHEHYDHISGVNWLKEMFDCKVVCHEECADAIKNPSKNLSKYFDVLVDIIPSDNGSKDFYKIEPYSCAADITFEKRMKMEWFGHTIDLISTPGHSKGSICILIDNQQLFSGDSLLRDYPTVTRLSGGSRKAYTEHTLKFLKQLSLGIRVYPGHFEDFLLEDRVNKLND